MYKLPDLPYGYGDLAPYISEEIMTLHHKKHHQTYVDKLNVAIDAIGGEQSIDLVDLLKGLDNIPESQRQVVRNNGGGHYNHSLFWDVMSPDGGGEPSGDVLAAINNKYGSFDSFKEEFSNSAAGVFGSGWVWLSPDVSITTSQNQDNPIMSGGEEPILGLDVWEHAYYLDYKNVRPDYVQAWWSVVNWRAVEERLERINSR